MKRSSTSLTVLPSSTPRETWTVVVGGWTAVLGTVVELPPMQRDSQFTWALPIGILCKGAAAGSFNKPLAITYGEGDAQAKARGDLLEERSWMLDCGNSQKETRVFQKECVSRQTVVPCSDLLGAIVTQDVHSNRRSQVSRPQGPPDGSAAYATVQRLKTDDGD